MKKNSTLGGIRLLFIGAFLCVGVFMAATYVNTNKAESEIRNVKGSLDFLLSLENIMVDIQAVETGQRGFTISGDEKFLESYYKGFREIRRDTTVLSNMMLADTGRLSQRKQLLSLIAKKLNHARQVVEVRRIYGYDSAAVYTQNGSGKVLMDQIEAVIKKIEGSDRVTLQQSSLDREKYAKRSAWQFLILALLFYIILFYSFLTIIKHYRRLEARDRTLKYNASLIRNISDPIITTDQESRITNWNSYAEKLYGYQEQDVLGKTVNDVLHIEYNDSSRESIMAEYRKYDFWKGEVTHYHQDGHPINVEVTSSAIRDADGEILGTVAVIRDITMRKTMEKQLHERVSVKSQELNKVFERITDAFIALDNNWNYVYVNSQAAIMHGKSPEELVGTNIWKQFPDVVDEPFYDALQKAHQTQQPQRLQLYYSKTGKWFEDLIYPSPQGISVYYHDITERKNAELELAKFNERFQLVAKATNDAIWDWDMQTDRIWGNEVFRQIFGMKTDYFDFKNFIDRIHEDDRQAVLDNFKNGLRQKKKQISEEFRFRKPDGSYSILYDRAYIIYNEEMMAVRMLGAMEDITEEREYERKLFMEKELSDTIINSLPGVFYLYNKEGKFYRWNKNFESVTGYTADEIRGLHPIELFPEEEKQLLQEKIGNVFIKGEDNVEASFMAKDGSLTPYFFTGMLINYEGEICLMGVGIDISERVRSQQRLKQSEEKFRTLIEQASDGIFISDSKGDYIDVNSSATMLTGYTKEELLQMNMKDVIDGNDQVKTPFKLEQLKDGKVLITERYMKQKGGSLISVEISAKLLPDGRFQGIVRDITARKKAEEYIRNSEEQRRLIMNAALDAIICIDTAGYITFWNPQAERVFGWTYGEVQGKKLSDTIIPPPYKDMHEMGMDHYLETGKGPALNVLLELTAIKRNGEEFPIELTVLPITQGKDSFFCAFIRDITERKKAEEELRVSEHKYRLLFTQNPMPMWMISIPERNFLDVNPAAVNFYGYSREEFLTMNIRDIRPSSEIARLEETYNNSPEGIYNAGVWLHQKKNGETRQVNIITHDIFYEGHNAKLVLANDVTDKIVAEENLRRSHEEFRQLATHLEHIREAERTHMAREIHDELGQQLTGLKMDISWLKRKIKTEEEEVQTKINDTIQLIDKTVITVRRIATELRPSILDDLGLVAAMEWQTEEFQKRAEIQSSFESNVAHLSVSPEIATGLFRIYQESLTNVSRHSAATRVQSSLHVNVGQIELQINDNGKGFDASEIGQKKTLGLLGMKERTSLMGGTYEISSAPGDGTSVRIIVPLIQSNPDN